MILNRVGTGQVEDEINKMEREKIKKKKDIKGEGGKNK